MDPNKMLIKMRDTPPEEAEERLLQLGFAVANLVHQVLHALRVDGQVHPLAAMQPVESQIISMPDPTKKQKMKLVAVMIPIELADQIKMSAIDVDQERKKKAMEEGGDHGPN